MISLKTISVILLGAMLCAAQTVLISGVVKDTAGVGMPGVLVKLESAKLSTLSDAFGVFKITEKATDINRRTNSSVINANKVQYRNGMISFNLPMNKVVSVSIHDVSGRQEFGSKRTLGLGAHSISLPMQTSGIHLCKVVIGNDVYSFKTSSFGGSPILETIASPGATGLAKQAKTTAVLLDIITATKTGFLNYRCDIRNWDTAKVKITMIENAGDLTDIDGNVYQTVKIGNQVWTTENFKCTKYNDGTAIPYVQDIYEWVKLTTPGYCWNSTDSASRQKWGAFYNWYAVDTKKLAPVGWHVPTNTEWNTMVNFLIANGYNCDTSKSEDKTGKSLAAQTDWDYGRFEGSVGLDLNSNNRTGFSALPGGEINYLGGMYNRSYWWSSTDKGLPGVTAYMLSCTSSNLSVFSNANKKNGYSIRLIKD